MLHISPQILQGLYHTLRECQPFRSWGLPPAEQVVFHVSRNATKLGQYWVEKGIHHIEVSGKLCTQLGTGIVTMAHEMCHLRDKVRGIKLTHGASFRRSARTVCRIHGWDLGSF